MMSDHYPPVVTEQKQELRQKENRQRRRWWQWSVAFVLLAAGAYFLWARSHRAGTTTNPPSPGAGARGGGITPVVAVKATRGDINVYLTELGTVTPLHTVTVRTQISGYLQSVLYHEGETVQAGDVLAEIDPRPYQVQLEQAQGNLAKDQATLNNAKVDLERYRTLVSHNAAPEQQLATQEAAVAQEEGTLKADQAQIDLAKLNLVYCHVRAPISGRIGLRLVDPGNYVAPNDSTGLVVITQLQPISVIFTVAEDNLDEVLTQLRSGHRLPADAYDRELRTKLASGWLTTLDNQIDPTTGTLKMRAVFDNPHNELFPNRFVNLRLIIQQKHGVTLVPTAAVQRNNQSTYVFLVKPDSTVTIRQVKVGATEGANSEIDSGLSPGDTVVMTGVDRLQEGSKVRAQLEKTSGGQP